MFTSACVFPLICQSVSFRPASIPRSRLLLVFACIWSVFLVSFLVVICLVLLLNFVPRPFVAHLGYLNYSLSSFNIAYCYVFLLAAVSAFGSSPFCNLRQIRKVLLKKKKNKQKKQTDSSVLLSQSSVIRFILMVTMVL